MSIMADLTDQMTRVEAVIEQARYAARWLGLTPDIAYVEAPGGAVVGDETIDLPAWKHTLILELPDLTIGYPLDGLRVRHPSYNGEMGSRLHALYLAFEDGREDFLYDLDDCILKMCEAIATMVRMCGPDSLEALR